MPRQISRLSGECCLDGCVAHVGAAGKSASREHDAVRHKLGELGFHIRNDNALPVCQVVIGMADSFGLTPPYRPEGYAMKTFNSGAAVVGHDMDGLFWGLITLQQLLNGKKTCPILQISDWPAFGFRMHQDDISRKQVSTLEDFKRIIRLLSYFKIRYYTPYMEDMLYIKSCPDIGRDRGRLTPNELCEIRKCARLHNVIIYPTYSLIGHQENLLANPKYRKYAYEVFQPPSSYDVSKAILRPYLQKVIRDVCELFPDAPIFNGCFDEVIGPSQKEFIEHANWCAAEVAKYGKRLMLWVDMFKNHYGLEKIHSMDKRIMPGEWEYGAPLEHEKVYREAGIVPWGLAGYSNWCCFFPDFSVGKKNMDEWAELQTRWRGPGFGVSQWGDNGYENSRDLCWNLFAYNGETAWTGAPAGHAFEKRFQAVFYGRQLKGLQNVIDTASKRRNSPRDYWNFFRMAMPALVRLAATRPEIIRKALTDLSLLNRSLKDVLMAKRLALREAGHMDHFTVAIERERNICRRMLLADRIASGLSGPPLRRARDAETADIMRVKRLYEKVWLKQFKRLNIEVSLAVYDEVAESLRLFGRTIKRAPEKFISLDIGHLYNTCKIETAGIPIGKAVINDVPFNFAGQKHTHAQLDKGGRIVLQFQPEKVGDVHLIYGAQTIARNPEKIKAAVEVRLKSCGKIVFRENLLTIRHLCDWWAPLGEHMWAGGGFKYVDTSRVSYAIKPGHSYGLFHLKNFKIGGKQADSLEIESLSDEKFYLYAVTIEQQLSI
jgi:hypothetical protein